MGKKKKERTLLFKERYLFPQSILYSKEDHGWVRSTGEGDREGERGVWGLTRAGERERERERELYNATSDISSPN